MAKLIPLLKVSLLCLLIPLLLMGCDAAAGGSSASQVWIDVPLDGLNFEPGQAVNIEGHASGESEPQVEIWVNANLVTTLDTSPVKGELFYFTTSYTPPGPGNYAIQALLIGGEGETSPVDTAKISVGGAVAEAAVITPDTATPVITVPPVITITPVITISPVITITPVITTLVPQMVVDFRADPQEIESGQCSNITWHVENATRVVFGGMEQPFDSSFRACLDKPATYPLTVTSLSGVEQKYYVSIEVTAPPVAVITTVVPGDSSPPSAPLPFKPVDGNTLGCIASTTVMWQGVSDASLDKYQVQVQHHSGDNNWKDVSGSPFTVSAPTNTATVPSLVCGHYYRWRVRAVDEADNESVWSGWFHFTVTLT